MSQIPKIFKEHLVPGRSADFIGFKRIEKAACGVFRIHRPDGKLATGFLCKFKYNDSINLYGLYTNNHVINNLPRFPISCHFMDEKTINVECSSYFFTDKRLDATFVEVDPTLPLFVGRTFLEVQRNISENHGLVIIQHPGGDELTSKDGVVVHVGVDKLHHDVPTLPGSSGSPVLNSDLKVVGIHVGVENNKNFGVRISAVLDAVSANLTNKLLPASKNIPSAEADWPMSTRLSSPVTEAETTKKKLIPKKSESEKLVSVDASSADQAGKAASTTTRSTTMIHELLLVAGGRNREVVANASRFDTAQGRWTDVSPMLARRQFAAAATLNGKVVVAGGKGEGGEALNSAEQYNADTNKWTPLPNLLVARWGHALVSVGSSVFALGGMGGIDLCCVERYDEGSDKWLLAPPLQTSRHAPAASAIRRGIFGGIVVAGGYTESQTKGRYCLKSCEYYVPSASKSTPIAPLNTERAYAAAATHADKVYVFGGCTLEDGAGSVETCFENAEQYDAVPNKWTVLQAQMRFARSQLAAICLNDRIYVIGGSCNGVVYNYVESFDPVAEIFSEVTPLPYGRSDHTIAIVPVPNSGSSQKPIQLLVLGGKKDELCDALSVFEVDRGRWTDASPMLTKRCFTAAATLNDKVVVAGGLGEGGEELDSAEQFDADTNKWTPLPSLLVARSSHALVSVGSSVFALGGLNRSCLNSVERYDEGSDKWQAAFPLKTSRSGLAASACKTAIVLAGGLGPEKGKSVYLSSCELYDPSAGSTAIAPLNKARAYAAAATHIGTVYVIGGESVADSVIRFDDGEQYDASANKWTVVQASMSIQRSVLGAVHFNGQIYLTGGDNYLFNTRLVEGFDPQQISEKRCLSQVPPLTFARSQHGTTSVIVKTDTLDLLFK